MSIDTTRAAFVQQAYRYAETRDTSVKSVYPNAKAVQIDSNLSLDVAEIVADEMFEETSSPAIVLNILVEGIYTIDAFSGGPPRFLVTAPDWLPAPRVMKLVGLKVDFAKRQATLKVRG